MSQIKFKTLVGLDSELYKPKAQTKLSVGLDVRSTETKTLRIGEIAKFDIGVFIEEIPDHIYLQLHVRSSLRFNYGLTQLGTGIIDADFKQQIRMVLKNEGTKAIKIEKGQRIGQLIPCENLTIIHCKEYIKEEDRVGGFGSTEKN
jgi:deoxyuridine 5'-triphosphate nucleotidohydrolase